MRAPQKGIECDVFDLRWRCVDFNRWRFIQCVECGPQCLVAGLVGEAQCLQNVLSVLEAFIDAGPVGVAETGTAQILQRQGTFIPPDEIDLGLVGQGIPGDFLIQIQTEKDRTARRANAGEKNASTSTGAFWSTCINPGRNTAIFFAGSSNTASI